MAGFYIREETLKDAESMRFRAKSKSMIDNFIAQLKGEAPGPVGPGTGEMLKGAEPQPDPSGVAPGVEEPVVQHDPGGLASPDPVEESRTAAALVGIPSLEELTGGWLKAPEDPAAPGAPPSEATIKPGDPDYQPMPVTADTPTNGPEPIPLAPNEPPLTRGDPRLQPVASAPATAPSASSSAPNTLPSGAQIPPRTGTSPQQTPVVSGMSPLDIFKDPSQQAAPSQDPTSWLPSLRDLAGAWMPAMTPQEQQAAQSASNAPAAGATLLTPLESLTRPPSSITPGRPAPGSATGAPGAAGQEPLPEIIEGKPEGFFATAGAYARQVERETGIPAALSLAVAANETGYGQRRYMSGDNNYHGIQAQPGEAGAKPYQDWRPDGKGGFELYNATQRSFASPLEGFRGFARFLLDNPRYKEALDKYRQTGNVNQLAADIHAQGYAEDPEYTTKITSIMRGIPADVTRPRPTTPTPSQNVPPGQPVPSPGPPPTSMLTPNQFTEGMASGLDRETALSICGPAAAVAFARANGRTPTLREAYELARDRNLWDINNGMHGPDSEVQLMKALGIEARVDWNVDWNNVYAELRAGRPVVISTPGHYFVAERLNRDGTIEFGNSAGVLRASGAPGQKRTSYRPEELAGLGMGSARAVIYMGGRPR